MIANETSELFAAAYIMAGLRHDADTVTEVFREHMMVLEVSSTYQAIFQKGVTEGERSLLLKIGRKRFGDPPPEVEAALADCGPARIQRLGERLLDAATWDDLLATP